MFFLGESIIVRPFQRNQDCYCGYFILIVFNQVRFRLCLGCTGSLISLYGPTFHVTPVDLCIIFQCNLYISCIMSCENKNCFKLFQIVSNCFKSPPLTIGGTVLKESHDLVILGVTFNSKMTFEKHLRTVSRAASQRLGILRKS